MRRILGLLALAGLCAAAASPAAAACALDARQVVARSPFLSTHMKLSPESEPAAAVLSHVDDPRIALIVAVRPVPPLEEGTSRAAYVAGLEEMANELAAGVRRNGLRGDASVYPFDPVSWRTLSEGEIAGVGPALSGHMETLVSDGCMLVSDFVSPNSINLLSRWNGVVDAVAELRNAGISQGVDWTRDDTTPTGWGNVLFGVGVPALAVLGLFALINRMLRVPLPGPATRVVVGCAGAVAAGAAAVLSPAYIAGLSDVRHVDGAIVLALVAGTCAAGAAVGRAAALLALLTAFVGSAWTGAATLLGWTPDATVTGAVAGTLLFLSLSGFYVWSQGASEAKIRRLQEERGAA